MKGLGQRLRTDPTFDEVVWLAPTVSVGVLGAIVVLGGVISALIEGEPRVGLATLLIAVIIIPTGGLAIIAMNMVVAYLQSVLVWHLTLRLTEARLGRGGAVTAAAAATALTASLILAFWLSAFLFAAVPESAGALRTHFIGAISIALASTIATVHTAREIERRRPAADGAAGAQPHP